MMKLYLNPNLFFLIKEGAMIVWDFKNHKQLEIEDVYIQRLKEISKTTILDSLLPIDQELLNEGLIQTEPYKKILWGWDDLSLIYHTGVQDIDGGHDLTEDAWVNDYMSLCDDIKEDLQNLYYSREGEQVALPEPNFSKMEEMSLWQSLKQRKTSRCFNGQSSTLEELSTLLFASFGLIHGEWKELTSHGFEEIGYRRSSPSGGALHPVEAYVFVFNIEGISPGVYHYNVKGHFLTRLSTHISYDELQ
ncbi:MAG: SagB/ThcOx family dehydrogenase, partial [Alphaproteobacteria bacterium]|nr:SagB/ThcOx family dehydrogenase [Alphaproteobacteria bacterium]